MPTTPEPGRRSTVAGQVVDEIAYAHRGVAEPDAVRRSVEDARDLAIPAGTIRTYLHVLVNGRAREQLQQVAAQDDDRMAMRAPEVLVVCGRERLPRRHPGPCRGVAARLPRLNPAPKGNR